MEKSGIGLQYYLIVIFCVEKTKYTYVLYIYGMFFFLRKINEILLFLKKDRSDHLRKVKTLDSVNAATVLSIFLLSSGD